MPSLPPVPLSSSPVAVPVSRVAPQPPVAPAALPPEAAPPAGRVDGLQTRSLPDGQSQVVLAFADAVPGSSAQQEADFQALRAGFPPPAQAALDQLKARGILGARDAKGSTVLETLSDLQQSSRPQLAQEAVLALQDRKNITQGPHYTCGAASVQNYLQKHDPAELVRIVRDLAQDGESQLRDGSWLRAGTGSLDFHAGMPLDVPNGKGQLDTEDRSDFDILFQSAAMRDIAFIGGDRKRSLIDIADYEVRKDTDGRFFKGDGGSDWNTMGRLTSAITGQRSRRDQCFVGSHEKTFNQLARALDKGQEGYALFQNRETLSSLHYVLVTGLDRERGVVTYHDSDYPKAEGSQPQEMPIADFIAKLRAVVTFDE